MHSAEYWIFKARQSWSRFSVPDTPHFDSDESTKWFVDQLNNAKSYLEYGTGGSTLQAASRGVNMVAVESDANFLRLVGAKIAAAGLESDNQQLIYADIGRTGPWGRPYGHADEQRLAQFRRYSDPRFIDVPPDLVLVDGRFRVACAAKCLNLLRDTRGWQVVVDDYIDRPHWRVPCE